MYFSEKHGFLFIANPKTGSHSVQNALKELMPDGTGTKINFNGKVVTQYDVKQGVLGHATASELKDAIGDEGWEMLNSMVVIRHPLSKLVSAYFFLRNGRLGQAFKIKGSKKIFSRSSRYFISTLSAKILPFKLWAMFYPYKSNMAYMFDSKGRSIVKYIARTEYLEEDFRRIMRKIGLDIEDFRLEKNNSSRHMPYDHYYTSKWFRHIMYAKVKDDLDFYSQVQKDLKS